MIQAAGADATVDLSGIPAVAIGHPQVWHSARFSAAEGDRAATRKLRCSEIPHAVRAWSHPADGTRFRIDPSDGGATAGLVVLEQQPRYAWFPIGASTPKGGAGETGG